MTDKERRLLLGSSILPVIVGNGISAHCLLIRLRLKYGMSPIVCGRRKCPLNFLETRCGFLQLHSIKDHRLTAEQLSDLSELCDDMTPVLIPSSGYGSSTVESCLSQLESRYIVLRSGKDIDKHPLFNLAHATSSER